VSPNEPPALMPPLPPFISPSLPSPAAPFYFPTLLYKYTSSTDFFSHPNAPFILYTSPAPLPLIFAFLNHFLAIPLLPAPSPTITHLLPLFPNALYPLPDPSYPPAPACSPSPHFRFLTDLWTLFGMYFCSNLSIHVHT
jgi:hypothetical protein